MVPVRRLGGLLLSGFMLLLATFGFYQIWTDRVAQQLAAREQRLQTLVADMDAITHSAVTSVRILRTVAERALQFPPAAQSEAGLLPAEVDRNFALPLDIPQKPGKALLLGRGEERPLESARQTEMLSAQELLGLMAEIKGSVPEAAWVYYTSARAFTLLYPAPPLDKGVAWSEEFLTHPIFAAMDGRHNSRRLLRWHEAYLDQAGMGLMTSLVAPVYDALGEFRAIVALDFTLVTLQRHLQREGGGGLYLVNQQGQVLAASMELSNQEVQTLGQLLPQVEEPKLGEIRTSLSAGGCRTEGRWRICGRPLQEAPWQVLMVLDTREVGWHALGYMQVEAAGILLLLMLLVAVERRRRMSAVMQLGDARYRRILDGSDQGFWEWNIRKRLFAASPRFDALLGYRPGESPLGRGRARDLVHPEDLPRLRLSVRRHLKGRNPFHRMEFRARTRGGAWRWLLTQGRVVERDERGRALMMAGTLTDVTERRRAEADLISAKQAAEAANVAKSRFLAAASHDLRQPLQASNLFISALERTRLDADQQKIARNLGLATRALGELLDALLDISKLDAGAVKPQLVPVEIYEIFQRIESEFASLALEKGLRFKLSFPTRPLIFETDPGLLMGLLRNLVGNAIRYTEWGGVLIGTRMRKNSLMIQVWDTGIGIKEGELPRIYEEFYQVDNPQRDRGKGLGLGLSIVRRMADLLGYRLDCKSRYGRGTVFEITIPMKQACHLALTQALPAESRGGQDFSVLEGCRCILVEDDPLVAAALETWLGSHGVSLRHFSSGDEAMADPDIGRADFYVTDFRMPGKLNGIQLLNAIQEGAGHPIRGLIVTGDTSREQLDVFSRADWPVLHKPIEPRRLLELMRAQFSGQPLR